jgi:GNAT superfamily N-acetyltransferase
MKDTTETYITDFFIRKANEKDAALVLSFIRELAEYEKLLEEVIATEAQLQEMLSGSNRTAEVVIGEYKSSPVGYALYFHNYSTFIGKPGLYLEDLYIKPAYRGLGLGKAMLSYLACVAVERNCGRFECWVLDWNKPAIDFYRRIGAEPMTDWTVQRVTGDALVKLADHFRKK